ncbi:hypothetical protein Dsin_028813 [Dipteronia sinensis]|uniref:RNase H type-1 domain-containing protein n=1 Tax=Dipteronia sinensis TaxID=43782 RepID=A0AAE0DVW7_9ROSI|nr:hypothetical protein Dsin_028813 [Dipteronia sinensis]
MENIDDATKLSDAQSFTKCLKFNFLVVIVILYEILNKFSKVASHDWERRRTGDGQRPRVNPSQRNTIERTSRPKGTQRFVTEKKSYAEVVGKGFFYNKGEERQDTNNKTVTMSVEGLQPDVGWLKRSAVGVLKVFANISEVSQMDEDVISDLNTGDIISFSEKQGIKNDGDRQDLGKGVGGVVKDWIGFTKAESKDKSLGRKVNISGTISSLGRKKALDKGKQVYVRKAKFKTIPRMVTHAKLDLEKRRQTGQKLRPLIGCQSEESTSDSDEDCLGEDIFNNGQYRGESFAKIDKVGSVGCGMGIPKSFSQAQKNLHNYNQVAGSADVTNDLDLHMENQPLQVVHFIDINSIKSRKVVQSNSTEISSDNRLVVDLGPIKEIEPSPAHFKIQCYTTPEDNEEDMARVSREEEVVSLEVNAGTDSPCKTTKTRGKKKCYSSIRHGMKTRHKADLSPEDIPKDGNMTTGANLGLENWNLEDEITKIVEDATKAGKNLNGPQSKDNRVTWNLEAEVANVIETGVALGLDFNISDRELVKDVAKRDLADMERKQFWEFLLNAQASFPVPWCFGGDFNTVRDPAERKGGPCTMSSLRSFNAFILKAKVVDIPMLGSNFTWTNSREKGTWAKLDRFLISPKLLSWYPKMEQHCLSRNLSDHCLITIGVPKDDWGPTPFRFFNNWKEDKEMIGDARIGWNECEAKGTKGFVLFAKAKAAKARLKKWQRLKKSQHSIIPDIEKHLAEVEGTAQRDGWSSVLRGKRLNLISALWKQLRLEEQQWRVGKSKQLEEEWAVMFRCQESKRPLNYLGLPLEDNPCKKKFWDPVVLKIEHRLAPWKRRFLSKGGRLVLIKFILNSIPIYYIRKDRGGLGIGQMKLKNYALLTKWVWRFGSEDNVLWKRVLCAKYGKNHMDLGWSWKKSVNASHFINTVSSLLKEGSKTVEVFNIGLQVLVGCGDRALFWEDITWDSIPIKIAFPRIYSLSVNKKGIIQDFKNWQGSSWSWKVHLRRNVLGWEEEQWSCFKSSLRNVKIMEVWTVWESRNSRIFEGKEISVSNATDLVKFRVGWWFKHHGKGSTEPITSILLNLSVICVDNQNLKQPQKEAWYPPYGNGLKFNVDGSSRGKPGPAGIRGVLRNSEGKILCLFSTYVGIENSNTTEIWAIHKALEVCASSSVLVDREIVIVSDSMVAVS